MKNAEATIEDNKNSVVDSTAAAGDSQFAGTVNRIFNDAEFAAQLETEPRAALESAGYTLSADQAAALDQAKENFTSTSDRPAMPAVVIPTSIRPLSSKHSTKHEAE